MRQADRTVWSIRRLLAPVVTALLAAGLSACAGAGGSPNASHPANDLAKTAAELRPAPLDTTVDADRDNDLGASHDDTNHRLALHFGRPASPSDRRSITALVKRYYRAAAADDGRKGCSMLYFSLAEAAPEDDSREPGTPAYTQHANTCTEVLDDLFRHFHAQLTAELPQLKVTRVRVEGPNAFAFLSFGALPERRISTIREARVWKMSQELDEELP
jgi:hypothetical protein